MVRHGLSGPHSSEAKSRRRKKRQRPKSLHRDLESGFLPSRGSFGLRQHDHPVASFPEMHTGRAQSAAAFQPAIYFFVGNGWGVGLFIGQPTLVLNELLNNFQVDKKTDRKKLVNLVDGELKEGVVVRHG